MRTIREIVEECWQNGFKPREALEHVRHELGDGKSTLRSVELFYGDLSFGRLKPHQPKPSLQALNHGELVEIMRPLVHALTNAEILAEVRRRYGEGASSIESVRRRRYDLRAREDPTIPTSSGIWRRRKKNGGLQ